jgi:4,4'-diaponeurosporenoate glycosyltransferase
MLSIWVVILLAVWLLGFFSLWRIPTCRRTATTVPPVSVVIPARNESHNLPRLLASLRVQSLRPEEVLVVDDHSEDDTAAVADAGGARVLRSAPLPPGWLGKPWACWQGALHAAREVLVFLDADTELEADGLRRIVSTWAERRGLVSVWPYHRMRRAYEQLSAFFHVVIMASMRAFTPLGPRLAPLGAFGPCVACARRDYLELRGHESVRGEILEDIALGQRFLKAGHQVHCLGGRGAIAFRMYPQGLPSLAAGFRKGMAAGARASAAIVLVPLVLWIAAGFIVSYFLAYSLVSGPAPGWPAWLGLYLLYALQLAWMLLRLGNYGLATALLYPVPAAFFAAVFALSLASTFGLRRVRWKGRNIPTRRNP